VAEAFSNARLAAVMAVGGAAMIILYFALEPDATRTTNPLAQISHIFWQYGLLADFLFGCGLAAIGFLALSFHFFKKLFRPSSF
jgi:hypothetical protein